MIYKFEEFDCFPLYFNVFCRKNTRNEGKTASFSQYHPTLGYYTSFPMTFITKSFKRWIDSEWNYSILSCEVITPFGQFPIISFSTFIFEGDKIIKLEINYHLCAVSVTIELFKLPLIWFSTNVKRKKLRVCIKSLACAFVVSFEWVILLPDLFKSNYDEARNKNW